MGNAAAKKVCRAEGCDLFGQRHEDTPGGSGGHFCDRCGDTDADHRARACPSPVESKQNKKFAKNDDAADLDEVPGPSASSTPNPLEDSSIFKWNSNQLAEHLHHSLPKLLPPFESNELKDVIAARARKHGIQGKDLIAIMTDIAIPGAPPMTQHANYKILFDGTDKMFAKSTTGVRGAQTFGRTIIGKIILANSSAAINETVQRIFSPQMIPEGKRLREYDCFYPSDKHWCIECGECTPITYESTVCRPGQGVSAVHGYYIAPAGWMRFALKTADHVDWSGWHKAYHGTAGVNVPSIIKGGLILHPTKAGNHGGGGKFIYVSPSIEYCSHYVYTDAKEQTIVPQQNKGESLVDWAALSKAGIFDETGKFAQYVFEVRVRPGSYKVQGNTLHRSLWENWFIEYDTFCNSRNLEWLLTEAEDIVVTGVMVRELPCGPQEWVNRRVEDMKAIVGWDEDTEKATRPRNHGSAGTGEGVWEFNNASGDQSTLSRSGSAPWKQYESTVSKVIEGAYQSYQRFVFIGKPSGAAGPAYFIDFGNLCDKRIAEGPEQRRADADKSQSWRRRAVRRVAA